MANTIWRPTVVATFDIWTFTVDGTWSGAESVALKVGDSNTPMVINVAITPTATADVAQDLADAWNGATPTNASTVDGDAADEGAFAEATATVSGSTVTITADTAGVPVTVLAPVITGGTGTISGGLVHTQTATGPNYIDNADNWSNNSVPVNGDVVYVQNSDVSMLYGLTALVSVTATINVEQSFTGEIGLPRTNANDYAEYRTAYLQTAAAQMEIGRGEGTGSGRIKINSGSTATVAITVHDTGTRLESDVPAVVWKGTGVTAISFNIVEGDVGFGIFGDELSGVDTLTITGGATVLSGIQNTIDTIVHNGTGEMTHEKGDITTLTIENGGVFNANGDDFTTVNLNRGSMNFRASDITTLNVGSGGAFDISEGVQATGITNATAYAGASINDPRGHVTWTNGIILAGGAGIEDVSLVLGINRTITPTG